MQPWPAFCEGLYRAATEAAAPRTVVPPYLPDPSPFQSVKLIAFGKAAAAMACAVERAWPDVPFSGMAVCRYGYGVPCDRIEVSETAHPVPDDAALRAGRRALDIAASAGPDDLLLVLISGGGSSLLCLPADGIDLEEKQRITTALLQSGAPIGDINCVRRHLSAIKGGRLAQAGARAGRLVSLAISDVVGDTPEAIASGPTVPDASTTTDAADILKQYGIASPKRWSESLKPGHAAFRNGNFHIIASGRQSLTAARAYAEEAGFEVHFLGDELTGEARAIAALHAEQLPASVDRPTLYLSGGELTVTVMGDGQGGPNQEYMLALMQALPPGAPVSAFAADTDGMDGTGGAAGAWFTPAIRAQAPDPAPWLKRNDSYSYFNKLKCSFNVKPTLTNVNDLRAIALWPAGPAAL